MSGVHGLYTESHGGGRGRGGGKGSAGDGLYIYHERQDSLLCGQHCLNNLLQGPYFTTDVLGEIAQELDLQEQALGGLEEQAPDDLLSSVMGYPPNHRASRSSNVDEAGNFSIQVLRVALQRLHALDLEPWFQRAGEQQAKDPSHYRAFIVNRREHWFTIRKIRNNWWNLNSSSDLPEAISEFFLSAFLNELKSSGYSVFIVSGSAAPLSDSHTANPAEFEDRPKVDTGSWHLERDLLEGTGSVGGARNDAKAGSFQAFGGEGRRLDGRGNDALLDPQMLDDMDEDTQLALAISASMEPQAPPTTQPASSKDDLRSKRLAALSKMGF